MKKILFITLQIGQVFCFNGLEAVKILASENNGEHK